MCDRGAGIQGSRMRSWDWTRNRRWWPPGAPPGPADRRRSVVTRRTDCGLTQLVGAITCGQAVGRITLLGGFTVDVNFKIKGDHQGGIMASYIALVSWTEQGIKSYGNTIDRAAASGELAGKFGATLERVLFGPRAPTTACTSWRRRTTRASPRSRWPSRRWAMCERRPCERSTRRRCARSSPRRVVSARTSGCRAGVDLPARRAAELDDRGDRSTI